MKLVDSDLTFKIPKVDHVLKIWFDASDGNELCYDNCWFKIADVCNFFEITKDFFDKLSKNFRVKHGIKAYKNSKVINYLAFNDLASLLVKSDKNTNAELFILGLGSKEFQIQAKKAFVGCYETFKKEADRCLLQGDKYGYYHNMYLAELQNISESKDEQKRD